MFSRCGQRGGSSVTMYASVRPSGEKRGEVSAAPVAAKGRTVPVATSTKEMLAVGQSSATGRAVCETAMVFPSGDQSIASGPPG